jgi:hypothetical protein
MSSFRRTGDKESYKTTVDWLKDFESSIVKKAMGDDSLQRLFIKKEKFSTIDEKMADIKNRIGFDTLNKTSSTNEHDKSDVQKVKNVLTYIRQVVKAEPHLDVLAIISRCRAEDGLAFEDLKLDFGKLKEFISSLLDNKEVIQKVDYHKYESDVNATEDVAEYYLHSDPKTNG